MLDKEMGTEAGEGYQSGSPDGSLCVSVNPIDLSQDFSPCLDHMLCRITTKVWGWSFSNRHIRQGRQSGRQACTHIVSLIYSTESSLSGLPTWCVHTFCEFLWGKFYFVVSEMFHCRHIVTCTGCTFARQSLAVLWVEKNPSVDCSHSSQQRHLPYWEIQSATSVREEPQFIKGTIALSWKFYL